MSQTATLRALDAALMTAFHGAGLADTGVYTALPGAPVPCRVYVDRVEQFFGGDGTEVAGYRTTLTLLRADVPRPVRGATVAADGVTYTLEQIDAQDASMSRWVVME